MLKFIDTHTHLYDEVFNDERSTIVERAKSNGLAACILPAIDKDSHRALLECESNYSGYLYAASGLHPTSVKNDWESQLSFVFDEFSRREYVAVGEVGMDGYWSKEFLREQAIVFKEQLKLAAGKDLPVIIHSRDSYEEIFEVLESCKSLNLKGVFHAFSGSPEIFRRIQKYGDFMAGIGGVITYKNAHIAETVKQIGLNNIILETDSPWLTPAPFRGKRNEPSYIRYVAQKIADITGTSEEEVAETTSANAVKLFNLQQEKY